MVVFSGLQESTPSEGIISNRATRHAGYASGERLTSPSCRSPLRWQTATMAGSMAQALQSFTDVDANSHVDGDADREFEYRVAALEKLKCAIIADISRAKPIRLHAASLGVPDWPAMQMVVALARLAGALNLPFELVDAPEEFVEQMDDAGIDRRKLNLTLVDTQEAPPASRKKLPLL